MPEFDREQRWDSDPLAELADQASLGPDIPVSAVGSMDPWAEAEQTGWLPNERPFRMGLRLRDEAGIEQRLGLPEMPAGVRDACLALIANLLIAGEVDCEDWVFYSRDRNHYPRQGRYRSPHYTYANVIAAVYVLVALGLVEHWKTAPSRYAKYRSRLRARPCLLERLPRLKATDFVTTRAEVIVLRDQDGDLIDYVDRPDIVRMRRDVEAQNRFLAGFQIHVDHPEARYDALGFLHIGDRRLNPEQRQLFRVFNRKFSRGGRWYGPFWQGLPSRIRKGLLIDGVETVEVDYCACHPQLLCAMAGLELPFGSPGFDPYAIPGIPRKHAKLAFNIMLNAESEAAARGALAERLRDMGADRPSQTARAAMDAVIKWFPRLQRYWNTGIGLRLQNFDATICGRVLKSLRQQGIPALPVHDSFIVPKPSEQLLHEVMNTELNRMHKRLSPRRKKY
jgi:hypothetical protein